MSQMTCLKHSVDIACFKLIEEVMMAGKKKQILVAG